jgi:hypothetical protein
MAGGVLEPAHRLQLRAPAPLEKCAAYRRALWVITAAPEWHSAITASFRRRPHPGHWGTGSPGPPGEGRGAPTQVIGMDKCLCCPRDEPTKRKRTHRAPTRTLTRG